MKTQVIERSGVLMQVTYEPEEPVTFHTVHLLDGTYRPVGPNLMELLHVMVIMVGPAEGETFLSNILQDLTVPV